MSGTRRRKPSSERGRSRRRAPQRDFWGRADADNESVEQIVPAADPTIMLHSLSSPPLPGRETVAVHYFAAVAEKAASLAVALAAASDLLDMGDDRDLPDEPASLHGV